MLCLRIQDTANLAAIEFHSHLVTTLADAGAATEEANKMIPGYLENPRVNEQHSTDLVPVK